MQISDLTSNAHYVALAAAGGLIAAGWRQIRGILSYVSGFLFVSATIDSQINNPLTRYLRREWKVLPSGKFWIVSTRTRHNTLKLRVTVPFKLPNKTSVYLKWPDAIVFNGGAGGTVSITAPRWTNVLKIVEEALKRDVAEEMEQVQSGSNSRYCVYDITGRDKSDTTLVGSVRPQSVNGGNEDSTSQVAENAPWMFMDIDRSFMYTPEEYIEPRVSVDDGMCFLPENATSLIAETEKWFQQREWFQHRAIPWRRGILLHGPGGTGKSTLAVILARRLAIPIYRFHLNTLSDMEFMEKISYLDAPCVVLFEDFDRVFNGRDSVKNQFLSFDTVINAMSGVKTLEGVIFVLTTNNVKSIDPAVGVDIEESGMSSRPGRIDRVLYMGSLPDAQRHLMIDRTLGDWPDLVETAKVKTENFTIVQTQEYCVQLALQRIH